jgi:hypothetical protein
MHLFHGKITRFLQVGLFAGIVSAFVIDARQDLQTDSEQNILRNIRDNQLQSASRSVTQEIKIPLSAKWINALWLLSLQITLFGAMMGIVVKTWLAAFTPATTKREALDACRRYMMDEQAKLWHLEEIITVVPLLVQAACFLFLVGLVIQSIGDHPPVGHLLLAFFLGGGAIYIAVSVIPLIVSESDIADLQYKSPFNTPLSDLVMRIKKTFIAFRSGELFSRSRSRLTDKNKILAEILYTRLIKPSKPEHVDEAAAEIALPSFKAEWIELLSQNESPQVLLDRFRQCALTRTIDENRSNAILRNHLLVFLLFVENFEKRIIDCNAEAEDAIQQKVALEATKAVVEQYRPLLFSLLESLKPRHPIHRWNNLREALQPLLFGLRAQILIFLQHRIPKELLPSKTYNPHEFDLHPNELSDRPWTMAFKDIRSSERLCLTLSACRGVLQGGMNLKKVSILILSLCLTKGASLTET